MSRKYQCNNEPIGKVGVEREEFWMQFEIQPPLLTPAL